MTHSLFRVLPWEHGGVTPAPSQILQARVEGRLRLFEVKVRENIAYFRRADEPDKNRVWALWNEVTEQDLSAQFACEVEANRVGRYLAIERGFSTRTVNPKFYEGEPREGLRASFDLMGRTSLAVVVADDGRGRAQEWCGGPWFDFELPPREVTSGARKPSIWHCGWRPLGLRRTLANLAGELAFRPFVPDENDDQKLVFVSGSQGQLEELYHAAHTIFADEFTRQWTWMRSQSSLKITNRIESCSAQSVAPLDRDFQYAPTALLAAFIEYNLPVGGQWRRVKAGQVAELPTRLSRFLKRNVTAPLRAADVRADYRFIPHVISFDYTVSLQPNAHEQLEARLFLRDWMRQTLPPEQFEKLKKYLAA